ncbi:MAG: hypothetical protein P8X57_01215, partial [Cyclobacteriaceae bacterium]
VKLDTLISMDPGEILVISASSEKICAQFIDADRERILEVEGMINMPDDRAYVCVLSPDSLTIEEVYYDHLFHHESLAEKEGWALERISTSENAFTAKNWMTSSIRGSPTRKNSQRVAEGLTRFWVDPTIIDGGNTLNLKYENVQAGSTISIRIFTMEGLLIASLGEALIAGTIGSLQYNLPELSAGLYLIQVELLMRYGHAQRILRKIYVL